MNEEGKWMGDGMNELCEQRESWRNGVFRHRSVGQNQLYGHGQGLQWISIASVSGKWWLQTPPLLFGKLSPSPHSFEKNSSQSEEQSSRLTPLLLPQLDGPCCVPDRVLGKANKLAAKISLSDCRQNSGVFNDCALEIGFRTRKRGENMASSLSNLNCELGRLIKLLGIYQKTRKSTRRWRRLSLLSKWQTLLRTYAKV